MIRSSGLASVRNSSTARTRRRRSGEKVALFPVRKIVVRFSASNWLFEPSKRPTVPDQFYDHGFGNPSIFEQRYRRVTQRVKRESA